MAKKHWPFDTPGNYSVSDAAKIEVADGVTKLKGALGGPNLVFYAKYNSMYDADFALGNPVVSFRTAVVLSAEAKIGAQSLQNTSGSFGIIRYDNGITSLGRKGTISFWQKSPTRSGRFVRIGNDWQANWLQLHLGGGSMHAQMYDSSNVLRVLDAVGGMVDDGDWHHYEFAWDSETLGKVYYFQDGILYGALSKGIWGRDNVSKLQIFQPGYDTTGYLDDLRIYNDVLHTGNFTPPVTEITDSFPTDKPYIQPVSAFNPDLVKFWNGFSEVFSSENQGSVKYVVSDDGGATWKYWTGAAWVTGGDDTNNNTASEINSNIGSLAVTPDTFLFRAYLISDGAQQVELANVALAYSHISYRVVINPDVNFAEGEGEKLNVSAIAVGGTEAGSNAWWFKIVEGIVSGANQRIIINPDADFSLDTPIKTGISADSLSGFSLTNWAQWWFRTLQDLHGRHVLINPDIDFAEAETVTVLANGESYSGVGIVDFSWWFETMLLPIFTELTGEWVNLGENSTVLKGQLQRFLKLISFVLDEVKGAIDAFPVILNVDKTDADYLPLIAALVGIDFNYDIPIPRQREEIKRAVEVYKTKGTIPAIKRFCRNIIGFDPEIAEWPPRILMSNNPAQLSARITTLGTMDELGLPEDQAMYSLDFSQSGDYRFDKFGIYFFLAESAGIQKAAVKKILRLLSKNIPASTVSKIVFVDYIYSFSSPGAYPAKIYHAFGSGKESWDNQLEQPGPGQTTLINEIHRRIPDSIVYLDANGYVTDTPTNKIRLVTILKDSEASIDGQYIREQGLFGGDATAAKDSGTLLGVVNHKGQWKTEGYRTRKTIELSI